MVKEEQVDGRWNASLGGSRWKGSHPETVSFQGCDPALRVIPEEIARLIYEEYDGDESFELVHARGGFDVAEALASLADIIERERRNR